VSRNSTAGGLRNADGLYPLPGRAGLTLGLRRRNAIRFLNYGDAISPATQCLCSERGAGARDVTRSVCGAEILREIGSVAASAPVLGAPMVGILSLSLSLGRTLTRPLGTRTLNPAGKSLQTTVHLT
jgi:hypothetical protein